MYVLRVFLLPSTFQTPPPKENVHMYEMAFEQQYHFGIFYAWVKLREQEIRNIRRFLSLGFYLENWWRPISKRWQFVVSTESNWKTLKTCWVKECWVSHLKLENLRWLLGVHLKLSQVLKKPPGGLPTWSSWTRRITLMIPSFPSSNLACRLTRAVSHLEGWIFESPPGFKNAIVIDSNIDSFRYSSTPIGWDISNQKRWQRFAGQNMFNLGLNRSCVVTLPVPFRAMSWRHLQSGLVDGNEMCRLPELVSTGNKTLQHTFHHVLSRTSWVCCWDLLSLWILSTEWRSHAGRLYPVSLVFSLSIYI